MENLVKENYDELINHVWDEFNLETREDAVQMVETTRLLLFGEYNRFDFTMEILTSDEFTTKDKEAIIFVVFCSDALKIGQCDGTLADRLDSFLRSDKFAEGKDEATVKEIQNMVTECANEVYYDSDMLSDIKEAVA